jgi:hypothetical protein
VEKPMKDKRGGSVWPLGWMGHEQGERGAYGVRETVSEGVRGENACEGYAPSGRITG